MTNNVASGEWGRIDDQGTVFVRTESGDRVVGSWQAADPEAGLAYYARRYSDLETEIQLLSQRLQSSSADPKHALTQAHHLRESLQSAAVIGDLGALDRCLEAIIATAKEEIAQRGAQKLAAKQAAVLAKETLVTEAEKLAHSNEWKAAGDRLRSIVEEWRTIRGVDRKTDDALWKRFTTARETFNKRRGSHFAELDKQRAANRVRKEALVQEAEGLAESTDWANTATTLKQLMVEWKSLGRLNRDAEEQLWSRFRAAQDRFFARRGELMNERNAERQRHLMMKEALLEEAEKIDVTDVAKAKIALRDIQRRWAEIGHVPREVLRSLEARLRAVEQRVRAAADAEWRRSDPTTQTRLEQIRAQVSKYETQAMKFRAAGDHRRAAEAQHNAQTWRGWLAEAERAVRR